MALLDVVPRSWTSLVLLAAVATPAIAQAPKILAVLPPYGSPGSQVLIVGSGFGDDAMPRVWLEFPGDEARPDQHRMRVLDWSDSGILALVLSGEAGVGQLVVEVAHEEPVAAAFKILKPQVVAFTPAKASPGDLVKVTGASFGVRRGQVLLFQHPCTVVDWSNGAVTFRVPDNVPDGDWTPRVANSIGEAVAFSALKVSGSPAELPAPFVRVRVGNPLFVAEDSDVVGKNLGSKLAFDAWATADDVEQHLSVLVTFAPLSTKVPKLLAGSSSGSQPLYFEVTPQGDAPPDSTLYVAKPSSLPWKVHVLGRSQGQLFGQFSAVLMRVTGPGPDTLALDEGLFLVDP